MGIGLNRASFAALVVPSMLTAGCASVRAQTPAVTSTSVPSLTQAQPGCQSDPRAGVHDPERLTVLKPCAVFEGTVSKAPTLNASDGDVTFDATPDPGYAFMLNAGNRAEEGLHIEIVPRDQPGCTPGQPIKGDANNLGLCSGANVLYPPLGAHIRVTGAWVLDSPNGWNEIHPAWKIEMLPLRGPAPPEQKIYKATLTGISLLHGAPHASGVVRITVANTKLCWSFSALRNLGKPTRADIHRAGQAGLFVTLGRGYAPTGCTTATTRNLKALAASPQRYVVAVRTAAFPTGAIQGRITRAGD